MYIRIDGDLSLSAATSTSVSSKDLNTKKCSLKFYKIAQNSANKSNMRIDGDL